MRPQSGEWIVLHRLRFSPTYGRGAKYVVRSNVGVNHLQGDQRRRPDTNAVADHQVDQFLPVDQGTRWRTSTKCSRVYKEVVTNTALVAALEADQSRISPLRPGRAGCRDCPPPGSAGPKWIRLPRRKSRPELSLHATKSLFAPPFSPRLPPNYLKPDRRKRILTPRSATPLAGSPGCPPGVRALPPRTRGRAACRAGAIRRRA